LTSNRKKEIFFLKKIKKDKKNNELANNDIKLVEKISSLFLYFELKYKKEVSKPYVSITIKIAANDIKIVNSPYSLGEKIFVYKGTRKKFKVREIILVKLYILVLLNKNLNLVKII